jgi:DNA polymerase-1
MIASYILNYNVKDDISYLASELDYTFTPYDLLLKDKEIDKKLETELVQKAKFIYEVKDKLIDEMKEEKSYDLFKDIEMKLAYVLSSMEIEGIRVNEKELDKMSIKFKEKIDNLTKEIYELSNVEFNIQSPKQLSDILFNKLLIPYPKKNPKSYSTSREILDKIKDIHPIVNKIIDYRTITKLYNTYIIGIKN